MDTADQRAAELVRVVPTWDSLYRVQVGDRFIGNDDFTHRAATDLAKQLRAPIAAALRAYGEQCRAEGARAERERCAGVAEASAAGNKRAAEDAEDTQDYDTGARYRAREQTAEAIARRIRGGE
jgi:hypothetical protein